MTEPIVQPSTCFALEWTPYERVPPIAPDINTWYMAGAATGQPVLDAPAPVNVTDGFGPHSVPVEPWGSLRAATSAAGASAPPGRVEPARATAIDDEVFLQGDGAAGWLFMETVREMVNFLITYDGASFCTAFGIAPPAAAPVRDGFGTHRVPITPWD